MSITEQDQVLLSAIKKTAIVLIVLYKSSRPLNAMQIGSIIDMGRDTVSGHLKSLVGKGFVQNLGKFKGHTLTKRGVQFAFSQTEMLENPAFLPTTSLSSLDIKETITIKNKKLVVEVKLENPAFLKNKNLLASCGVGEPSLSRISNLEYVNPEFLMDHISRWRKEKQSPGLLIHRIDSGEKSPRDPGRELSEVERNKYTNW